MKLIINEHNLKSLTGNIAIGHVRYSTTGDKDLSNCQPLVAKYKHGSIALAHNGNLTNSEGVREMLEDEGVIFQSTTDSEAILNISRELNTHIKGTQYMFPQVLVGGKPGENPCRLSPEEAARKRVEWLKLIYTPEEFKKRLKAMIDGVDAFPAFL